MSALLEKVSSPADVKELRASELPALAKALREEIVCDVSKTGGHLASSLGVVELVIALMRVFEPERDRIVWDVGHQTYAWKILTGRRGRMNTLRSLNGISGFCNPEETPCDAFVSGHAGNALSVAQGMAAARDLSGSDEHIVAVVGDAALSNGMSLEALNFCDPAKNKVILIVNDNAMSISRNVGACARLLGRVLTGIRYNRAKAAAEKAGHKMRLTFLRDVYHRIEQAVKSLWLGNSFFESFGFRYIGPVDGHDCAALEQALTVARDDKRSVAVHVVTQKGRGFAPAEADPTAWHGVGPFELEIKNEELVPGSRFLVPSSRTGAARRDAFALPPITNHQSPQKGWSETFGDLLADRARKDDRICALTAAMRDGTGLTGFAKEFPSRFFDAGICEEHLIAFAAGLAKAGQRPVVAIYSSFLQRAIDQMMHDVCLLNLPVIIGVDRAGCVGHDGRTHHGMFDIAMLRSLPNLTICQPSDAEDLARMLDLALSKGGPWVIRYPRGIVPSSLSLVPNFAEECIGKARRIAGTATHSQLETTNAEQGTGNRKPGTRNYLWALGDQVAKARKVAELLEAKGVAAGVVDARFVKPFDAELLAEQRAAGARIVSLENGSLAGGFGEAIGADMKFGWPDVFVEHGTVAELEARHGFTAEAVAEAILNFEGGKQK